MDKRKFVFMESYLDSIEKLKGYDEGMAYKLAYYIIQYGINGIESDDPIIQAIMEQIKIPIDSGKNISEKNSENGKKGGRPNKNWENSQKADGKRNESEEKQKENKNKKEKENKKENKKENNSLILKEDNSYELSEKTKAINNLIFELKETANANGISYEKEKEREFARHILTAKEYGLFAEKIGQDRITFAKNIMIASIGINYRRGPCAGPKKIYQNYAEVYNKTIQEQVKRAKNQIESF